MGFGGMWGNRYGLSSGLHRPVYESSVRSKRPLAPRLCHRIRRLPPLRLCGAQCSAATYAQAPLARPRSGPATTSPSPLSPTRLGAPAIAGFEISDLFRLERTPPPLEDVPMPMACLFLVLVLLAKLPVAAQSTPTNSQTVAPTAQLDYPDTTSGLEHLAKDIMKAQKANDGARADVLLRSLILRQPREWYERVFGPVIAKNEGALYESAYASVPPTLARQFLDAANLNAYSMEARRFDRSCDDNAGEFTFGILHARLDPVPLYEIRFLKGDKMLRLFSFAYVNGGFRFIIPPKLEGPVFPPPVRKVTTDPRTSAPAEKEKQIGRVAEGGNVQAARVLNRVQPQYPDIARREHLQGKVRLHAIIGREGSFAESSLDAVRKWRYSPTVLMGDPVEVNTQIDVIFQLSR